MFICINFASTGKLSEETVLYQTREEILIKVHLIYICSFVPLITVVLWEIK